MWPYPWTHVGTPSHLGHMDRVAATMPSQAHAGAAQEAPDIGQWEGQDVPLVRPSSCNVKGGIPSSRVYLPTYLHIAQKGSSHHDMSCPSKGITLCQSLIGTQGEFLCNTNTCALHSKVILTHAISWPMSCNANSTLLTMIHYTSAHVWGRKAYNAS